MQYALPFDTCGAGPVDTCAPRPCGPPLIAGTNDQRPGAPGPELVRHPRARRYVIHVRDDGTVRITVPRWGSKRGALEFAERERAWIEKQRHRTKQACEPVEELTPGAERELRERAKRELPLRLRELAVQHGLTVARVSVRNQRSRWGSCARSGMICLNWRLLQMPAWVQDYVMLHELMHLKRMDHSPRFWKLVAAVCPEYQKARRWLRRWTPKLLTTADTEDADGQP